MASTFNEIAYMVLDQLNISSDDKDLTLDHIYFLMKNWRSFYIKQRYSDVKKDVPVSNLQTICLKLVNKVNCLDGHLIMSVDKIPDIISLNGSENIHIQPMGDIFNKEEWVLVSPERFVFAGRNKWTKKTIFFTIGVDQRLHLKSYLPDFEYLKSVKITALFEDPIEVAPMECDNTRNACNFQETRFPIEEALVPVIIESIVKELTGVIYRPEDDINNASNDLRKTPPAK